MFCQTEFMASDIVHKTMQRRKIQRPTIFAVALLTLCFCWGVSGMAQSRARETANPPLTAWWQKAVVYQVYPRSFMDSNGDGIGDLNGVTAKLDYLKALGVDTIWLNPCYPSPELDTGYDISDYKGIDPQYGTMADFDRLVAEAKKRHLRVIMDLVLLHSSNQHSWFIESRSSRTNPKADWYVWRDGKANGEPPNNWQSFDPTSKSAWTYEPKRNQYYYHLFRKEQPGLNWRNPELRKEMWDTVHFWLDRGVDGFRLDAIANLFEDREFRDNEAPRISGSGEDFDAIAFGRYTWNLPEFHAAMRELRHILDSYPGDRVLIGETDANSFDALVSDFGHDKDEIQLPMNFALFWSKFSAPMLRKQISVWDQNPAGGWPLYFFSNHDFPRAYDRLGNGSDNDQIAKVIAALLLTMRGTTLLYYGEEIGMSTASDEFIQNGMEKSGKIVQPPFDGRAGARTPMHWDSSKNAGFSTAEPWLPVPTNFKTHNVEQESKDPDSILNLYKRLISLRRRYEALESGSLVFLDKEDPVVLAYLRRGTGSYASILVALNLSKESRKVSVDLKGQGLQGTLLRTLIETEALAEGPDPQAIQLSPYGILVAEVK
jgi:alpha-glucosidase